IENTAHRKTFVVRFPLTTAGAPIMQLEPSAPSDLRPTAHESYRTVVQNMNDPNPYAPFASERDWKIGMWAKTRGPGSTAFDELLAIEEVAKRLALSYKNTRGLDRIIDKQLPSVRPRFERYEIVVAGEAFEVFFRDILKCVEALYGDPDFAGLLLLVPERHYTDEDKATRVYFDMNTGKWWWATQKQLEKDKPGATVIPIIISSDKTQLTLIGNKSAYPVYMTLGNLPKDIRCKPSRRGQILLAYLPTSRLQHIKNKAARRRTLANLFHACMTRVLAPLASAGVTGMRVASGDGVVRRGHPILATYIGDYPEQLLVTGCKTGECPKCPINRNDVGESTDTSRPLQDLERILRAVSAIDEGPRAFTRACAEAGIKPICRPFWADLPYTDIYLSITPDVLHQLYQGVLKHLVSWLYAAFGTEEIDARCRRMPLNHNLQHFGKGISTMSRITGREHQDIGRILLGLVVSLELPNGQSATRLVRATWAVLNFLYYAQYGTHTTETLRLLDETLVVFHDNKGIFVELGIRTHFHLPKLHSLDHYCRSIELFGTTDNYNTQYSERLHIDFTKDAYRATNHKDEFAQMTIWLEHKEKMQRHERYVQWRLTQTGLSGMCHHFAQVVFTDVEMTRYPSVSTVKITSIPTDYGARFFRDALTRFIAQCNYPEFTPQQIERESARVFLPFQTVPTYHKIKFWVPDPHICAAPGTQIRDVIHVRPAHKGKYGDMLSGRFDTALVRDTRENAQHGIHGLQVTQVRIVFKIPKKAVPLMFPKLTEEARPYGHLAYVEWFSPFTHPEPDHCMYKVSRDLGGGGERTGSIIAVDDLKRSCHLFPDFGPIAPREWTSSTVLELCPSFYVNPYVDRHMFKLIF
ncbi:hypothetical protein BD309DRAFT_868732, partial [Dichomitus squalens]